MKLHTIESAKGTRKNKKFVGRGPGSGWGKTCGKGQKGQKCRSGNGKPAPYFEGGQMPLIRRLPKVGFTNIFRKEYAIVNLKTLSLLELEGEITAEILVEKGTIKAGLPLKILGSGELTKPATIKASKFSKSAVEKIEKSGGQAVVI